MIKVERKINFKHLSCAVGHQVKELSHALVDDEEQPCSAAGRYTTSCC